MSKRFFSLFVLVMSLILIVGASGALASGPGSQSTPATLQQQSRNMQLVGQIGGETRAVAVQGTYAYIGVGPRLVILNISNPSSPSVVGQSSVLPGMVQDVAVAGSYAYVVDESSGLRIINVSNPAAAVGGRFLRHAGVCRRCGGGRELCLRSRWIVAACASSTSPTRRLPCGGRFLTTRRGHAVGVAVAGGYAYVVDGYSSLRIINVSNPAAPTEVGFLRHAGVCLSAWRWRGAMPT